MIRNLTGVGQTQCPKSKIRRSVRDTAKTKLNCMDGLMDKNVSKVKGLMIIIMIRMGVNSVRMDGSSHGNLLHLHVHVHHHHRHCFRLLYDLRLRWMANHCFLRMDLARFLHARQQCYSLEPCAFRAVASNKMASPAT
jgi:hypothetical protein